MWSGERVGGRGLAGPGGEGTQSGCVHGGPSSDTVDSGAAQPVAGRQGCWEGGTQWVREESGRQGGGQGCPPPPPHLARISTVVGRAHTQLHVAGRRPPAHLASHLQRYAAQGDGRGGLGEERADVHLLQARQHHHELLTGHGAVRLRVPEVPLQAAAGSVGQRGRGAGFPGGWISPRPQGSRHPRPCLTLGTKPKSRPVRNPDT